jgi:predicted DCC family thiol-disulfide oxidoreductase YuxK
MVAAVPVDERAPASGAVVVSVEPVVLYDGVCGLCAASVRWILRHERDHALRFAPLQGPTAAALRQRYPEIPTTLASVVFVADGKAHLRSKAFVHLARHLRAPWRWARGVRWMPGFVMDLPYRLVARLRYRLWGKRDQCEVPAPEHRVRFLD